MVKFGEYIRARREALGAEDPEYGLRRVAGRVGISPTYLSRLENDKTEHLPSTEVIEALAQDLQENPDILLAMAGKASPRLIEIIANRPEVFATVIEIIAKRPELFAQVIEQLDELPDHAIVRVVREVRDGNW